MSQQLTIFHELECQWFNNIPKKLQKESSPKFITFLLQIYQNKRTQWRFSIVSLSVVELTKKFGGQISKFAHQILELRTPMKIRSNNL